MSNPNSSQKKQQEGFYLLPNLITTAGLFSGFYAIISATNGQFVESAIAIFIAMIFDGLDGRVARMTGTQSEFGAQFDSMADIVSFGIAPAMLAYNYGLLGLGKIGWLSAFVYVVCAALRLARFNTQLSSGSKTYFQGLASPAAAAVVASSIWVATEFNLDNKAIGSVIAFMTVSSGLLMVSNFRYSAFKHLDLKNRNTFISLLVIVLLFVLIAARPAEVLFTVFILYALSGPALGLRSLKLNNLMTSGDADFDTDISVDKKPTNEASENKDKEDKS